jgi:hypothetical protein
MLVQRIAEVLAAVEDDGMEISEQERAACTSLPIMRPATER